MVVMETQSNTNDQNLIYLLYDGEGQIRGIFTKFDLAKEIVELLCSNHKFDRYDYPDNELTHNNLYNQKLCVRLSNGNYSANPHDSANPHIASSWSYYEVHEFEANKLIEF